MDKSVASQPRLSAKRIRRCGMTCPFARCAAFSREVRLRTLLTPRLFIVARARRAFRERDREECITLEFLSAQLPTRAFPPPPSA